MSPSHLIAACFALISFAAAAIVGVIAGNSATTVLGRALVIMVLCWVIGQIVGMVAQNAIDTHITRYKEHHPIPQPNDAHAAQATTDTHDDLSGVDSTEADPHPHRNAA